MNTVNNSTTPSDPSDYIAALHELAKAGLEQAQKQGATDCQVMALRRVRIAEDATKRYFDTDDTYLIFQLSDGDHSATGYQNSKVETLEEAIAEILQRARAAEPDPYNSLPYPLPLDVELATFDHYHPWGDSPERLRDWVLTAHQAIVAADPGLTKVKVRLDAMLEYVVIVNSNGFYANYSKSTYAATSAIKTGSGGNEESFAGFHLDQLDAEAFGQRSARNARALAQLPRAALANGTLPVLFSPNGAIWFMEELLAAISMDSTVASRPYFSGELGNQIMPESVSIEIDLTQQGSYLSAPFDHEGTVTRRTTLVENGRLSGYVLDARSASKLGKSPTGNKGLGAPLLYPGSTPATEADCLTRLGTGLYVTASGRPKVDPHTGEFSMSVFGKWLENGEIVSATPMMVQGSMKDVLRNIVAITPSLEQGHDGRGFMFMGEMELREYAASTDTVG